MYELLAQRFDLDCFFSAETEPYANPLVPAFDLGNFRRVELRRLNVFGQSVLPGLARHRHAGSVRRRRREPHGPAYGSVRVRDCACTWSSVRSLDRDVASPRTLFHRATRGIVESVYRRSDAIVVYGDHVRRALLTAGCVDDEKIFTAAQSVDGTSFGIDAESRDRTSSCSSGHFEAHKGIDDLLAAFSRVSDTNARLSVVGNGSLEPDLQRQARIDPRINIVGYVPQRDLPRHFERARGLVLPSVTTSMHRECWGWWSTKRCTQVFR